MNEERLIKVIDQLLLSASIFSICGLSMFITMPHNTPEVHKAKRGPYFTAQDFVVPLPEEEPWWHNIPISTPKPPMPAPNPLRNSIDSLEIHYTTMEFEYVGRHFITAYCPEECGYNGNNYPTGWTTSSSTICHYSDKWDEPTTCAIDRNFHRYNEIILIGDPADPDNRKIYITEDTGPGVKGLWVDCFVETYSEVKSWNTRYDSVYNVYYINHVTTVGEVQHIKEMMFITENLPGYKPYPFWDYTLRTTV